MDREVVEQKLESLLDWHIVHDIAKKHLAGFSEFAKAIALTFNDAA
ncbi:MAG: hypothetical protein LH632_13515 [Rhodoferax sp.]|nr:hypothetical protein [Rhodoferax sp.]